MGTPSALAKGLEANDEKVIVRIIVKLLNIFFSI
jgi:hypothetical protein